MFRRTADLVADLWAVRVPLADAIWTYAVFWDFLINITTSLLTLGLVAAKAPNGLAVAAHVVAIPWNLLVLVAVWRSAAQPQVPPWLATAVRAIACGWTLLLSAT